MHRSRLTGIVIDCQDTDLATATAFWSQALGKPVDDADEDGDGKYASLKTEPEEIQVIIQRVDHPSRVHLDIEADDLDAEADRLEALGARRVAFIKRWWVMEAPTGHRFCIVRKQRDEFGPHVNTWDLP
jgi:predicted enzyme related to lactoylglutathione lyase